MFCEFLAALVAARRSHQQWIVPFIVNVKVDPFGRRRLAPTHAARDAAFRQRGISDMHRQFQRYCTPTTSVSRGCFVEITRFTPRSSAPLRPVPYPLVPQLVSRLIVPSPDTSGNGGTSRYLPAAAATGGDATCFALCPGPGATPQAPTTKSIGPGRSSLPRVVVGYLDGSIACAAVPMPMSPSARSRDVGGLDSPHGDGGAVPVRRLRPVGAGGEGTGDGGGAAVEAAITALCSLSAPLVVAGDSDGRVGLWTISSKRPSSARYIPKYPKLFIWRPASLY